MGAWDGIGGWERVCLGPGLGGTWGWPGCDGMGCDAMGLDGVAFHDSRQGGFLMHGGQGKLIDTGLEFGIRFYWGPFPLINSPHRYQDHFFSVVYF